MSAVIHQLVLRKRAVAAQIKADALARDEVIAQAKGEPGVIWRGQWDKNTEYVAGDAVGSKGSSYIALETSQGQRPPGKSWDLLAEKGKDGKAGADGKNGVISIGSGKGGADLSSLPVVHTGTPQAVAVRIGGVWVQMQWAAFLALLPTGGGLPAGTTTVNGAAVTVEGEYVTVTED